MADITFNSDLVGDLALRKVVLFLGSGVSSSAKTKSGRVMRGWERFLRDAAKFVQDADAQKLVLELIDNKDYLLACEVIKLKSEHEVWRKILIEEYAQSAKPSALHEGIIKLGQRVVITTNFDKLLEKAWDEFAETTRYPTVLSNMDGDVFRLLRDDNDYIIKLHGSIDDPDNIVFAKGDYVERAFGNWAYGGLMEVLLLTHTFLFIGFSMNDPAINFIVEQFAQKYPKLRPHYMFLSGPIRPEISEINRKIRKLFIMPYDSSNNHAELEEFVFALAAAVAKRRAEIIAETITLYNRTSVEVPDSSAAENMLA